MSISKEETIALLEQALRITTGDEAVAPVFDPHYASSTFNRLRAAVVSVVGVDMQNHPFRRALIAWLDRARAVPSEDENALFQDLFVLLSNCFKTGEEIRIDWLGKLLLYKIFSEADVQQYLANPALQNQLSDTFRQKYQVAQPKRLMNREPNGLALMAEGFFSPVEDVAILAKRGSEACQQQSTQMMNWLLTETGRTQFRKRIESREIDQSVFEEMLLDLDSDDRHKVCCLMMIAVFYKDEHFKQDRITELNRFCTDIEFSRVRHVQDRKLICAALLLVLTSTEGNRVELVTSVKSLFRHVISKKGIAFDDDVKSFCSVPTLQWDIFRLCDEVAAGLVGGDGHYNLDVVFDVMITIVSETRDPIYQFYLVTRLFHTLEGILRRNDEAVVKSSTIAFQKLCELSRVFDRLPEAYMAYAIKILISKIFRAKPLISKPMLLTDALKALSTLLQRRPELAAVMVDQLCENYDKNPRSIQCCIEQMDFSSFDDESLQRLVLKLVSVLQNKIDSESVQLLDLLDSIFSKSSRKLEAISEGVVTTVIKIFKSSGQSVYKRNVAGALGRLCSRLRVGQSVADTFIITLLDFLRTMRGVEQKKGILDGISGFLCVDEAPVLSDAAVSMLVENLLKIYSEKALRLNAALVMKSLMLSHYDQASNRILPKLINLFCENNDKDLVFSVANLLEYLAILACGTEEILSVFKAVLCKQKGNDFSRAALKRLESLTDNKVKSLSGKNVMAALSVFEKVYIEFLKTAQEDSFVSDAYFHLLKRIIFSLIKHPDAKGQRFAVQCHDTLLAKKGFIFCDNLLSYWCQSMSADVIIFSRQFLTEHCKAIVNSAELDVSKKQSMLKAVLRWIQRNPTNYLSAELYDVLSKASNSREDLFDKEMHEHVARLTSALKVTDCDPALLNIEIEQQRSRLRDQDLGVVRSARQRLADIAKHCSKQADLNAEVSTALSSLMRQLIQDWNHVDAIQSFAFCRLVASASVCFYESSVESLMEKIKGTMEMVKDRLDIWYGLTEKEIKDAGTALRAIGQIICSLQRFDETTVNMFFEVCQHLRQKNEALNVEIRTLLLEMTVGFWISEADHPRANEMVSRVMASLKKHDHRQNGQLDNVALRAVKRLSLHGPQKLQSSFSFVRNNTLQEVVRDMALQTVAAIPTEKPKRRVRFSLPAS